MTQQEVFDFLKQKRLRSPQEGDEVDVRKTYAHHTPTPDALCKTRAIRKAYSDLHDAIEKNAPPSRERSVALTELETSAMWAIKSVVCNDPESQVKTEREPTIGDCVSTMTPDGYFVGAIFAWDMKFVLPDRVVRVCRIRSHDGRVIEAEADRCYICAGRKEG